MAQLSFRYLTDLHSGFLSIFRLRDRIPSGVLLLTSADMTCDIDSPADGTERRATARSQEVNNY